MRTHFRAILAALISGCAFCLPVSAVSADSKRLALLFGNGHYRHAEGLRDPVADVTDLSASLARSGYAVRVVVDADYGAMRAALRDYAKQADGAEAAIVYFAGYGMEMNGEDWLVPVDAELRSESAVENEAVSLKSVVSSVSNAQSLGLVILDAARANPFDADMKKGKDGRSVARGLVGVETPDNVFVAQSAKEGEVAPESAGRLSPFTAALVSRIGEPGLQIEYLFRDVGDEVAAATDRAQEPTLYGDGSDKPAYVVPAGETAAQGPPIAADQIAWSFLEGTNDVASLHAFAEAFPQSTKQGQASARIGALEGGAASPVLAVAVNTDPVAEAPLLLATGVGTAEDAAKLARRFKGDTTEVQKAWAVIAKVGNANVSNAFQSLFPGVARRTVHAARRPSQAARVAGGRQTPFHLARRAPVHATLPVFVVRPRVTTNPLVALRDDAYAGRRPSPLKRVAVRERECEARRWYRDVRQDFDDCGVPWGVEGRSEGPVALYNPQAFDGGRYLNRDLNLAAGVIGPEPTGAGSLPNGQPSTASAQESNNPATSLVASASPTTAPMVLMTGSQSAPETSQAGSSQATAGSAAGSPSSSLPTAPTGYSIQSVPPRTLSDPAKTMRQLDPLLRRSSDGTRSAPAVAGGAVPSAASSGDSHGPSLDVSTEVMPVAHPAAATSPVSKTSGGSASTDSVAGTIDATRTVPGAPTATASAGKASADATTKTSGNVGPPIPAIGGAAPGSTGVAQTSTAATATETTKAVSETPSVGTGAATTGNVATATAGTTVPPEAIPTTSSQVPPVSGSTGASSIAMTEVSPVSTTPVVAVVPIVTKPVTIVSTGSPASSDASKASSPTVSATGPSTASAAVASLGSTALSASVHPPHDAPPSTQTPPSQATHVPSHRPSMLPAQPARSTASLSAPVASGLTVRPTPAAVRPGSPVRTAAIRTIPRLVGAVHDTEARPAEHRAAADRIVRAPARLIPVAPVHLRPTFLVLHQPPRREMAPTRPAATLQPFVRAVQRVAPPVRLAPPIQRIEMPRMMRPVAPQIPRIAIPQVQRIAVPQIQRIAVPQIQRIVIPTIGAAQIARPMMPMMRRPGQ